MTSEKLKKELKDLLKDPANRYCADCGKRGPTWASINIGCFVCLSCSGIHRSLGTHVSQVRSVDLDTWKPEWVAVMKEWGNEKANAVWEAKMPEGYDGKPNETEAQDLTPKMQKFIKDKYERKKFYSAAKAKAPAAAAKREPEEEHDEMEKPVKQKRAPPKSSLVANPAPVVAPAAPAVASSDHFNPFGDDSVFGSPVQAAPQLSLQPPAPPVAAAKPSLDLSSLYAQSQPAPAPAAVSMNAPWAQQQMPQPGIWPQTQQPMGMAWPNPSSQPAWPSAAMPPQQQQQQQHPLAAATSGWPAAPGGAWPQPQVAAQPPQMGWPTAPAAQQPGAWPVASSSMPAMQQPLQSGAWPTLSNGWPPQASAPSHVTAPVSAPVPAVPATKDPFSGLF